MFVCVCKDDFRELARIFTKKRRYCANVCVCVCVKTNFRNYNEISQKINKFCEKDEISECLCVRVKTIFANYNEISQKINKFREKDEITRKFCVCKDDFC